MARAKKARVAIVRGDNPEAITLKALELIEAQRLISASDKVLVKPNYITQSPPSTGITTDTRVVKAVVKFVKACGAEDVTVGDGGGGDTHETFKVVGLYEAAERHKVKLVDFNDDELVNVPLPSPAVLKEVKIAKTVLDSTCVINVPCLKAHELALVTLGLKNLVGIVIPRHATHRGLHENLVALAQLVKPRLTVISGIVGHEGHQTHGNPVKMDLVIAGSDSVATDAVGAAVMDVEPRRVKAIWLAEKMGLGTAGLDAIEVLGESVESVKRHFKLGYTPSYLPSFASLMRWKVGNWDYHILSNAGVISEKSDDLDI
ncbi:MAG: DUF362 domain-containing protein [Candidatus Bathyarchaeia archaeon]